MLFKPGGLSSPCGPNHGHPYVAVSKIAPLFKVGQPLLSWQRPYWRPSL